jgi:hypothetical protein
MPQVFSPGEPETRPLDPDAIVYTTPQKVADLLEIGPQDAVAVSADSESTGVFVSGANYRSIGFAVGDTLLIYSDADPLGLERTITAITSTINGVRLGFSSSITAADYQSADNTYVQNTASFTNGRTRGVTYDKVKQLILRSQDRIDKSLPSTSTSTRTSRTGVDTTPTMSAPRRSYSATCSRCCASSCGRATTTGR